MRYPTWQHHFLRTADRSSLERTAAHDLGPALDKAIAEGAISGYHFLRKNGGLRLRVCPDDAPARKAVTGIIAQAGKAGHLTDWTAGIYEPETHAFGGSAAMDAGHELFCRDSHHILGYLAAQYDQRATDTPTPLPGRRECAILLASAMMRAEGLDLYEQGDVWAKIAELRPGDYDLPTDHAARLTEKIRRLITVDTGPRSALVAAGPLAWAADWIGAFEKAGRALARLAREGTLDRGQRAVTAHHLIFHFNRLGLTARDQALIARLTTELIMNDTRPTSPNTTTTTNGAVSTDAADTGVATLGHVNTATLPDATDEHAAELRAALTTQLRDHGPIRSQAVADAFAATPRHVFVPGTPLADAYADSAVYTKHDENGTPISALSQPTIVALMLEQLDVRPGHHVLELGAGTGYNAALLGHLAGPTGRVTTIDVDADLVGGANEHLAVAGVTNVEAILTDGALGHPDRAPYDRITLTVGAGDVPTALLDQLAPGGRLLIPLRLRGGISRSIALELDPDGIWHSISVEMCTFMPLRGIADDARTVIALTPDGQVTVHTHREQNADPAGLSYALDYPPAETYTGVLFGTGEPFDQLDLYLACVLPGGLSRMPATGPAAEAKRLRPQFGWGAMAAVDGDTIAYLTLTKKDGGDDAPRWEVGVIGHGPRGAELASTVAEHIRTWDREYRGANPAIRVAQGEARTRLTGRFIIDKPDSRIAVDWN